MTCYHFRFACGGDAQPVRGFLPTDIVLHSKPHMS
jgi:hypothetical protein